MSEEPIKYYNYSRIFTRTPKVSSNLLDHFDSKILSSQILYDDLTSMDDGAKKHDVESWGCYIEYSGEGSIGLTFSNLVKKNSGYVYSRMYYYASVEPDFQIITRFETNMVIYNIKLKYNSDKIIGIAQFGVLNSTTHKFYVYFEFGKDENGVISIGDLFVETIETFQNSVVLLTGYKSYYRVDDAWSPERTDIYTNFLQNIPFEILPTLSYISRGQAVSTSPHDIGSFIYQAVSTSPHDIGSFIYQPMTTKNIPDLIYVESVGKPYEYKVKHSDYSMNPLNQTTYFSYDLFVEGVDDFNFNGVLTEYGYKYILTVEDNFVRVENLNLSDYKFTYGNYYKKFNPKYTKKMIKGEIFGIVGLNSCEFTEPPTFKVKCTRVEDDFLIGYYDVVDNSYRIPNLNYNELYDITLIDNSMNLEQKILSKRRPTLYTPLSNLNGISLISANRNEYNRVYVDWIIIGDFEETILYKSNAPFDSDTLPNPIYTSGIYPHYVDFALGTTYYYMASAKLDDVIVYSELTTFTF